LDINIFDWKLHNRTIITSVFHSKSIEREVADMSWNVTISNTTVLPQSTPMQLSSTD